MVVNVILWCLAIILVSLTVVLVYAVGLTIYKEATKNKRQEKARKEFQKNTETLIKFLGELNSLNENNSKSKKTTTKTKKKD